MEKLSPCLVEHYTKQSDPQWLLTEYTDPNVVLAFSAFEFQVAIADLYEKIPFDAIA